MRLETGKRKTTDYVARQYIGNLGKTENGIVSVNAYGVLGNITFPLIFKIFKPKARLQNKDVYKTKPQRAREIINELKEIGFNFKLVLADSLYGESDNFIEALNHHQLSCCGIRSNHSVLMPPEQRLPVQTGKSSNEFFRMDTEIVI